METSTQLDLVAFAAAVLIHFPLFWIRLDHHNKPIHSSNSPLIQVDLIIPEVRKALPVSIPIRNRPRIQTIKPILDLKLPLPITANRAAKPEKLVEAPVATSIQPKLNFQPNVPENLISIGEKFTPKTPVIPVGSNQLLVNKRSSPTTPIPSKTPFVENRAALSALIRNKSMFVITGPLNDRAIERQVSPNYPDWAQAKAIEASVTLEFTVSSDGNVKNNVVVRRTSGYSRLDETAIEALRQWKFVALPGIENREEVGLITFKYSLK